MAYEIPQMSLKQATLPQGSFTPITYTPQMPDLNLLQRSLAQIEARHNAAVEQSAKFNEVATKLETMVNPAEQAWVRDYIDRQSQEFNSLIASGDYGAATRMATLAGSNLLKNPEAIGRIKNQEKYKEFTDRIIKDNDISSLSKERALAQNAYGETEDITDNNNNIIGVKEWKPLYTPVKNKSIINLAALADKFVAPFEETRGGSNTVRGEGGFGIKQNLDKEIENFKSYTGVEDLDAIINKYKKTAISTGTRFSRKRITEEELKTVFDALYATDTDAMQSLLQDYDDINWKLTQLNTQLNSETDSAKIQDINNKIEQYKKSFCNENGKIVTPEEYLLRRINPILASMAYDNITNIIDNSTEYSDTTPKNNSTSGIEGLPRNTELDNDTGTGASVFVENSIDNEEPNIFGIIKDYIKTESLIPYNNKTYKKVN